MACRSLNLSTINQNLYFHPKSALLLLPRVLSPKRCHHPPTHPRKTLDSSWTPLLPSPIPAFPTPSAGPQVASIESCTDVRFLLPDRCTTLGQVLAAAHRRLHSAFPGDARSPLLPPKPPPGHQISLEITALVTLLGHLKLSNPIPAFSVRTKFFKMTLSIFCERKYARYEGLPHAVPRASDAGILPTREGGLSRFLCEEEHEGTGEQRVYVICTRSAR